jgi:protease-4
MREFFRKLFSPITGTLNFIQNYFKSLVFILVLVLIFGGDEKSSLEPANLTKLDLNGPILDSNNIIEKIDKIKKNENIKGVLLNVNSPGGAVAPSVEIAYAIKELNEKKPVVAYASGTMASGSYYASIWADKIVANPGSMIGSIGVLFQGADLKELIDKIGIKPQIVKAGKYKEAGTFLRAWEPYEKKEIESLINDTYQMFIKDVSSARGLDPKDHNKFADAKVFTADGAKKVGLIDKVGNITDAKKILIKKSKVKKAVWEKKDKFEKFFEKMVTETLSKLSASVFGLLAY